MSAEAAAMSAVLQRLQEIDKRIRKARTSIDSCDGRLSEVGVGVKERETEAETTSGRVDELRAEERRLQRSSSDKRVRIAKLEERLREVKTPREEAAVQAEMGLVRRVLDSEEQEAMNLLDQIERFEARLADQQAELEEARNAAEPRRKEILAGKEAAERELVELEKERQKMAQDIDGRWLRVYDNLIRSGRESAVAPMLEDGACGACYSVIPLQIQNEVRAAADMDAGDAGADAPLVICEACGVIVTAPQSDDAGQESDDSRPEAMAAEAVATEA